MVDHEAPKETNMEGAGVFLKLSISIPNYYFSFLYITIFFTSMFMLICVCFPDEGLVPKIWILKLNVN